MKFFVNSPVFGAFRRNEPLCFYIADKVLNEQDKDVFAPVTVTGVYKGNEYNAIVTGKGDTVTVMLMGTEEPFYEFNVASVEDR